MYTYVCVTYMQYSSPQIYVFPRSFVVCPQTHYIKPDAPISTEDAQRSSSCWITVIGS